MKVIMRFVVEPIGAATIIFLLLQYTSVLDFFKFTPLLITDKIMKPILGAFVSLMIGLLLSAIIRMVGKAYGFIVFLLLGKICFAFNIVGFRLPNSAVEIIYIAFGFILICFYAAMLLIAVSNQSRRTRSEIHNTCYGIWNEALLPTQPLSDKLNVSEILGRATISGAISIFGGLSLYMKGPDNSNIGTAIFAGLTVFIILLETAIIVEYHTLAGDFYYWLKETKALEKVPKPVAESKDDEQ
jgi:hypothetical protein